MIINKPATIHDVARISNVSAATVSKYLNRSARVSPECSERIAKAIQALNYTPNKVAQSLKTSQSKLLMMVVPDIANQYYAEQYKIVQTIGGEAGYTILLYDSGATVEGEKNAIRSAQAQQCDGLLFLSVNRNKEVDDQLDALKIPVVRTPDASHLSSFEKGIYVTTRYLIELGHKDILYVGGNLLTWTNQCRCNAFMCAMDETGLSYDPSTWFEMDFTLSAGYKRARTSAALRISPRLFALPTTSWRSAS